jgi:hypothetical protein
VGGREKIEKGYEYEVHPETCMALEAAARKFLAATAEQQQPQEEALSQQGIRPQGD